MRGNQFHLLLELGQKLCNVDICNHRCRLPLEQAHQEAELTDCLLPPKASPLSDVGGGVSTRPFLKTPILFSLRPFSRRKLRSSFLHLSLSLSLSSSSSLSLCHSLCRDSDPQTLIRSKLCYSLLHTGRDMKLSASRTRRAYLFSLDSQPRGLLASSDSSPG